MRIVESVHATVPIRVREARTDDMREMIDRIGTNPARVPGIWQMDGVLVVHPVVAAELRRRVYAGGKNRYGPVTLQGGPTERRSARRTVMEAAMIR